MAEHNHITRGIKDLGACPGCDEYHVKHAVLKKLAEFQACALDDDNDFKRVATGITQVAIDLIDLDRRSRSMIKPGDHG